MGGGWLKTSSVWSGKVGGRVSHVVSQSVRQPERQSADHVALILAVRIDCWGV